MHQLAHHLQQQGMQYFPDLKEAKFAEFWAHSRRHSSGGHCLLAELHATNLSKSYATVFHASIQTIMPQAVLQDRV